MPEQRRLFPSTSMLMAFDTAANTGSFSAAARELNLTQGAISRQITALENQLDVELFKRIRKSIVLTETGRIYAQEIHNALQIIRNASLNAMSNLLSGALSIAVLPTFGTRWLIPRFPQFLEENPDIIVNFVTKIAPFDFRTENIHAAVHYGTADWPETRSTFLMGEIVIPVCSPTFLKENPISSPSQLIHLPLLHISTRPNAWSEWFHLAKLDFTEIRGMQFEQFSIATQAAIAGLGIALLPQFLIQSELDRGELVITLDIPLKSSSSFGYYLVTPNDHLDYPPLVAFQNWLLKITKQA